MEMLDVLRSSEKAGLLSGLIIDEPEGMPSSTAYRTRFGSLFGVSLSSANASTEIIATVRSISCLRELFPQIVADVIRGVRTSMGGRL